MNLFPKIYLASSSPRRRELLTQLGVKYSLLDNNFDEKQFAGESPTNYVQRLAQGKVLSARANVQHEYPVLGADTIVVLDNKCLGKPSSKEHANSMLLQLSGRTHKVYTAVHLSIKQQSWSTMSETRVVFTNLSQAMIASYCETDEPMGKAGSYAIQGMAASFIERIEGSYTGVVGLPLAETAKLLQLAKVEYGLTRKL